MDNTVKGVEIDPVREKLIELLADSEYMSYEKKADHLIANGVTFPVRCKECKHWQDIGKGCTDHVRCCEIGFYMIGENGYCYFGERKDND